MQRESCQVSDPTQSTRSVSVSTPLGGDVLVFKSMSASEGMSQLFEYELELLSEQSDIGLNDMLGQSVTVLLVTDTPAAQGGKDRFFNGQVSRFSYAGTQDRYHLYQATLRPWFWNLTRTSNCRIFQEMTVPDIVAEVLRKNGFSDFEFSLSSGPYRTWTYCVQYRETDFNFICRLLEQEGIYFYFRHQENQHSLAMTDSVSSHNSVGAILYFPPQENVRREGEFISEWYVASEVRPGKFVTDDFNYETPSTELEARLEHPESHAAADGEIYDYPGEYSKPNEGETYAQIRLQELQTPHIVAEATSNCLRVSVGELFNLENFTREDQNQEYLITSASYQIKSDAYVSGGAAGGPVYSCQFSCMDRTRQYRAPRLTPKPVVQGPQTAFVVGRKGEEIDTDKLGRVKVQFHWDREGKMDEKSSCWVRVSQNWAGKNWGGVFLPRIGQEVIVDFLEGDPDRPIITGRVYNGENTPPYTLPNNKTQSGIKSRSTKQGEEDNFNELRFEDKKGEEEVYFHAEKDFMRMVENDDTLNVGNDRTTTIKEGDDQLEIEKGHRNTLISEGNDTLSLEQGDMKVNIDVGEQVVKVAKNIEMSSVNSSIKMDGNTSIEMSTKNCIIEALSSIELKVGGSSIKIEPAKITIKSPQIAISADGKLDVKSPMTTVNGDGILTLKGGLTKIN
ncbi:MAG: type VI secretion system tip protein VgrG [gamma proteobacterium endosymbiont of Lamellibrachia anaximandri]|nr:type VI secretion system tip protein VgrG [gamma proteobacterium endosymbiont of Lamellibrachia anaximandri]